MKDRYPRLLRTGRQRWWRPLLGVLFVGVLVVLASVAAVLAITAVAALLGADDPFSEETLSPDTPLGLLANNLAIALILPCVLLAVVAVHRERTGLLSSVEDRLRWPLLGRLLVVALGVVLVFFAATFALPAPTGTDDGDMPDAARLIGLFAVILLTTPLQAAAEEYGFRGYLTQGFSSWFARDGVGTVVPAVVTAVLFALAHGVQDPWLFSDRLVFGLVASWLAWRTGGLEAAVALHVANNLVSLGWSALTGTISESLTLSSVDWPYVLADVAMMLTFATIVHRLARRWDVVVLRTPGEPLTDMGQRPGPTAAQRQDPTAAQRPDPTAAQRPGTLSGSPAVGYPDDRSGSPSYEPRTRGDHGD